MQLTSDRRRAERLREGHLPRRHRALVSTHLIGSAVTDLIAELALAKTTEINHESLIHTIHAHPTFAEAIRGATEDALGRAMDL